MELLATQRRVTYVNEPFHEQNLDRSTLPTDGSDVIVGVPSGFEAQFRSFLSEPGATRLRGPYNPFGRHFEFFPTRRVVKLIEGTSFSDWIDDQDQGFTPVYLIRHPLPSALSLRRRGDSPPVEVYLEHQRFCERYLSEEALELSWRAIGGESRFLRCVIDWCLYNIVPWTAVTSGGRDWLTLTYEELVTRPDEMATLLAELLQLPDRDRLRANWGIPSVSTDVRRVDLVAHSSAASRLGEWQERVDESEVAAAFELVRAFGIDAYDEHSVMPADQWLHFPPIDRQG